MITLGIAKTGHIIEVVFGCSYLSSNDITISGSFREVTVILSTAKNGLPLYMEVLKQEPKTAGFASKASLYNTW